MAKLSEVTFSRGTVKIGTAFEGVFEKAAPHAFVGLSKIRWLVTDPEKYVSAQCHLEGTYVDGGQGAFLNDMTLYALSEAQATANFKQ